MKHKVILSSFLLTSTIYLNAYAAGDLSKPATSSHSEAQGATSTLQFEKLDTNKDGYVSAEEARNSADLQARFQELDKNRDGKISASEVASAEKPSR